MKYTVTYESPKIKCKISSNNVKFENSSDHSAHDALLCISQKTTVNQDNRCIRLINIMINIEIKFIYH